MSNIQINLNSSNVVENSRNTRYRINFTSPLKITKEDKVCISQCNIFYSWYNISSKYNNNKFKYKWFNASGILDDEFEIILPDGNYSIPTINDFLQNTLYSRLHYIEIVDSNPQKILYYFEFKPNSTYYSIQLNVYPMITSAEATVGGVEIYKKPLGATWDFPLVQSTPQLEILNNNFTKLIGFENGLYPLNPTSTIQSFLSTSTPQLDIVSGLTVTTNIVNQIYSIPSNVLYQFPISGVYGGLLKSNPNFPYWVPASAGNYQYLEIEFFDQNFNTLDIKDNQISVTIIINLKEKEEKK